MLWLYLHFPTLQMDTLFRQDEDSNLALAIVDGRKHTIVQLNQEAEKQGLQLGMGLGSAAALCQDLQVHPYEPKIEERRLTEIAQWLYLITSDISLCPPNGILIKVTNMLSLYSNMENYWQTLSQHLAHLQVHTSYSTGLSPYAATLMAKQSKNWVTTDTQQLKDAVRRYPISLSGLPTQQVNQLQRVGIHHINDLLALPLPEVAKRFDIDLVNYIGKLTGQFKHPIDFYHPPELFCYFLELLFDIENIAWLEKPLNTLFQRLELFLKLRDSIAYELNLVLHQREHQDKTIQFHSAQGDYLATKWQALSALTLENIRLDSAVTGLTLSVARLGENNSDEYDLFEGVKGNQTALELASTLQAKLGQQAVVSLLLCDDPRPEMATQIVPFTISTEPCTRVCPPTITSTLFRPSLLYPHPIPLTTQVKVTLGPERIVSGWWDGNPVKRDYFVARNTSGQWLWIFRTEEHQWFVHGQFS
ncbi:Y-family DNA polymerase [Vibrio methylphosphonaticus]|uniref:Y-family DNA polymerase n=1 Tax=Vibrio methylphosphonaticus TaxID=2946866 RepID=UPI00202A08AB|nr:DNA polymerase Y family protein [Vibrio methylphosphonaticus]MCL9774325.1 DNA polymerase Y family protein [Vibrio methylphosphonaticus]